MADFYNITKWYEKPWFQTGGTRSKVIVENPQTGEDYYFKSSLKKEKKDYKYEFWSEIIASEMGSLLGFNMLRYDIAYNRGEIGCLSKSMITEGKNKLNEGISFLTGYDTTYYPGDKKSKKQYTFQFIHQSLKFFGLGHFIENIIEIIVLDSIIGNGDRHQENWGIITEYNDVIRTHLGFGRKAKKGIMGALFKGRAPKIQEVPGKFSPIYDSGSCLGRELDDTKIKQMLTDDSMIESYIRKGVSEIHWEGEKLNHLALIEKIKISYPDVVKEVITRVKKNYTPEKINNCILNIDDNLPPEFAQYELPLDRKKFMMKLVSLRLQKLLSLVK